MKLKTEEIQKRLLECESSQDFYNLYELVFGEEVPETQQRDPNELLEDIIYAISDNKKINAVILPKDVLI